jgi:hypothetical protein
MIKSCEKETKKKEISPKSKKPAVYKKKPTLPNRISSWHVRS